MFGWKNPLHAEESRLLNLGCTLYNEPVAVPLQAKRLKRMCLCMFFLFLDRIALFCSGCTQTYTYPRPSVLWHLNIVSLNSERAWNLTGQAKGPHEDGCVQLTWLHYSRIPISIPVILVCCFYMCQIFILWWWDLWCSDPSRNHPSRPDREPQQQSCSGIPRCFCDMIKSVSLGKNKNKYPIIWPNLQFNSPGIYMFIREMTYCK